MYFIRNLIYSMISYLVYKKIKAILVHLVPCSFQGEKQAAGAPQDGAAKGGIFSPTAGYAAPDSKVNRWSM